MKVYQQKGVWLMSSDKHPDKVYRVARSEILQRYTCDCPDWIYRGLAEGRDCKHIIRIQSILDNSSLEVLDLLANGGIYEA